MVSILVSLFIFLSIYLFLACRVLSEAYRILVVACGLLSSCGMQAAECVGSLGVVCRLGSCGVRA